MKRPVLFLPVIVLAFFSCSRMATLERVDDKKLGIPDKLVNQFAVQETPVAVTKPIPPSVPAIQTPESKKTKDKIV